MKRLLQFIFSHSLFAALCAASLGFETYILLNKAVQFYVLAFIFLATLGSYNLYWLLSKHHFSAQRSFRQFTRNNITYGLILFASSVTLLFIFFKIQWLTIPIIVAGLLTLVYTIPLLPNLPATRFKKYGFFKTIILAFTWSYVTVILPAWQYGDVEFLVILFLYRFAFMLTLCFMFDMRDAGIDKINKVYTLANSIPRTALKKVWAILYISFIVMGIVFFWINLRFQFFPAFIILSALVLLLYQFSLKKKRGYYFYYFLVDGLMLASSLLMFFSKLLDD